MSEPKRIDNPRDLEVSQLEPSLVQIKAGDVELQLPIGLAEALARSILERCPRTKD